VVTIFVLSFSYVTQFSIVLGESPVFGPNTNVDSDYESNVDSEKYDYNNTGAFDNLPVDILSTVYSSDGKTLKGTIWLSDAISDKRHADYLRSKLNFTMSAYVMDDYGFITTAFDTIVFPEIQGTWAKEVRQSEPDVLSEENIPEELVPVPTNRIVETIHNYTSFYKTGQRYVDISVDLSTIGLFEEYWVSFSVNAIGKSGTALQDYVLSEHAPQRKQAILFSWPTDLKVNAGEEITSLVPINTSELNALETDNLTDANPNDGIILNFEPSSVSLPITGTTLTKMSIRTANDAYNGTRLIGQNVTVDAITEDGIKDTHNETLFLEIAPPLPPISILEKFSNILRANDFSYAIPLGISSVFAILIWKRLPKVSYDPERIRVKDVITVDASVIAGVLIFLTVASSEFFQGRVIQQVGILTASIVFPFAIAAIRTLAKGTVEAYGIKLMISGFIYLMTSIVLIAFIQK
jgi:hypothetical protein